MKTLSPFEKIAKKNKRSLLFKIILISVLLTLGLIVVTLKMLKNRTAQQAEATREYYDTLHTIVYPNIDYHMSLFEPTSAFSGYYYMDRVKHIAGIKVPYEDISAPYGAWERRSYMLSRAHVDAVSHETATYTLGSGYKSPMFYNRDYDYNKENGFHMTKTQDLAFLDQMPGYAVEMALTFDRPYTLSEIEEKIPDNLTINWYWIGTSYGEHDTASLSPEEQIGFSLNPYLVRDGKPADEKEQAAVWEESYRSFRENLEFALEKKWLRHSVSTAEGEVFNLSRDAKWFLEANKDAQTARFAGVILTGRSEDFAPLKQSDWIFASNIGQSVHLLPYHTLEE